jgi:molybdopterin/thiamine biosynthesis adenylyltransferase
MSMVRLLQVGAGSGGIAVLDAICRDPRITHLSLIEPDIYKSHNVERHLLPAGAVGQMKADLAAQWLRERRPDLEVGVFPNDLLDQAFQTRLDRLAAEADVGVCAVDNEPAKFHWDALMRRHAKPWTLGEVLSGGIGGFVHWFVPGGPCYGCVASFLKRSISTEKPIAPDYSNPGAALAATTVPAGKAAIQAIAALHALVTLGLLDDPGKYDPGFTTLLLTLARVPGVFDEAFRPYRFRIARLAECLICRPGAEQAAGSLEALSAEELDVALDQALARLGND